MRLTESFMGRLRSSKYSLADLEPAYYHNSTAFLTIPSLDLERIYKEYLADIYFHKLELQHPYRTKRTEIGDVYLTDAEFREEFPNDFNRYRKCLERGETFVKNEALSDKIKGTPDIQTIVVIPINEIFVFSDNKIVKQLEIDEKKEILQRCLDPDDDLYCYEVDMGIKMHMDLCVKKEGNIKLSFAKRAEKWARINAPKLATNASALDRLTTTFNPHKESDSRYKPREKPQTKVKS